MNCFSVCSSLQSIIIPNPTDLIEMASFKNFYFFKTFLFHQKASNSQMENFRNNYGIFFTYEVTYIFPKYSSIIIWNKGSKFIKILFWFYYVNFPMNIKMNLSNQIYECSISNLKDIHSLQFTIKSLSNDESIPEITFIFTCISQHRDRAGFINID
jgi:hypothetical protein